MATVRATGGVVLYRPDTFITYRSISTPGPVNVDVFMAKGSDKGMGFPKSVDVLFGSSAVALSNVEWSAGWNCSILQDPFGLHPFELHVSMTHLGLGLPGQSPSGTLSFDLTGLADGDYHIKVDGAYNGVSVKKTEEVLNRRRVRWRFESSSKQLHSF